ncbi:TylF/MycF/NovP-related O-methyltransferase [Bosea sp. TAF32]|uniref:TylF/MycF family methyltransferase n=1 Tax=Bosea sp. TAF32 TaxID=3237482 RepID=UPI003F91304D
MTQSSFTSSLLRRLPILREEARKRDDLREAARKAAEERDAWRETARKSAEERNALVEQLAAKATLEDQVNHLLQRIGAYHDSTYLKLDNVSAQILGVSARQEEAVARLGRRLRGDGASLGGDGRAAELYLDLLEASLTGLLIEDASQAPWTERKFDPSLRAIGRDWPEQAITMIGTARMRNLRMLATRALEEGVPGDFIETGVWRGGACIYAKGIFEAYGAKDRKVFVADSFRGLPEPDSAHNPADTGDTHHTYGQLAISREAVSGNFRRYGLLDEQVVFLEGWFKDTLPAAPIDRLAVLRLDGDMYESTMDALNALYHKVSPGGFVIVDDYVLEPCAKAIHDFRGQHGIEAPMEPVDGAAVWWRVPL